MRVLDYIRIVVVSDICTQSSNVTYNIVYSEESAFCNPKRGVFTLSLYDFIDTPNLDIKEIEKIASRLNGQLLIRGKEEDGTITILHLLGLPLSDWLMKNAMMYRLHQVMNSKISTGVLFIYVS
ncbi:MAG TPA: hypothetical protein VI935_00020 [Thermodesulfobacteriota bacterium]|nr:hypothetical protein [Thermodesulfobacteriota bacterium]